MFEMVPGTHGAGEYAQLSRGRESLVSYRLVCLCSILILILILILIFLQRRSSYAALFKNSPALYCCCLIHTISQQSKLMKGYKYNGNGMELYEYSYMSLVLERNYWVCFTGKVLPLREL